MTKAEIQLKAAEQTRFIMINSTFSPKTAKDAIRQANSRDAKLAEKDGFMDLVGRELQYFQEYVTGGFYTQSKLERRINRLTDGRQEQEMDCEERQTWTDFFSKREDHHDEESEDAGKTVDPRPRIYLALFSLVVGFGLLELVFLSRSKSTEKQNR